MLASEVDKRIITIRLLCNQLIVCGNPYFSEAIPTIVNNSQRISQQSDVRKFS